jgi:putative ABC transport system ATP-binding protein
VRELGMCQPVSSSRSGRSGGQRQALTVLMATMVRPTLLLLDEHTAALDPRSADQIVRLSEVVIARTAHGAAVTH